MDLSAANFTAIFDAASNEYKSLTGQDLASHPFAATFENSNSPNSVLDVFRKQAQIFDKFCRGDDKLMAWLTPIVNILFTLSETLGEGIGLVSIQSMIFQPSNPFQSLSRPQRRSSRVLVFFSRSARPALLDANLLIFNPGGEECYCELRSAFEPLRAHSIFPSTSLSLHGSPARARDDGVACEDHGPAPGYTCAFSQDNERDANQLVCSIDILFLG